MPAGLSSAAIAASTDDTIDDEIGRLYGLPPAEFIAARDELAKRLTKEGDKDGAATVKAVCKPTVAAYAVNQLSRTHAAELRDLLDLGEQLRDAQQAMLEGSRTAASEVKDLSARRRKAVDDLAKKASRVLGADAHAQRDAIANTLDAAVASAANAELVRRGRLVKELPAPSGFGDGEGELLFGVEPAADSGGKRRRRGTRDEKDDVASADADAVDEHRRRRKELEAAVDNRKHALAKATDEAGAAAREADAAREEVGRLEDALAAAKRKADAASERARRARDDAGRAQRDLDDAERALRSL